MKLSKTSLAIMAIATLLTGSLTSNAQPSTNPPADGRQGMRGGVEAQITRLTEELKLTDAQKSKVKTILEEQGKKRQEMRGNTDQTERRAKMQALQADTNKKMKEVLTADQFTKFEGLVQQRNRRQGGATGQDGAAPKTKNKAPQ